MPKFIVTRNTTTDFVVNTDDPDSQQAVKQVQEGKITVSTQHTETYRVREMVERPVRGAPTRTSSVAPPGSAGS